MAATSNVKKLKPTDDQNMVKDFARKISAQKQRSDDERMELASIYKEAEDKGLNRSALKLSLKIIKQDEQKSQVFLDDLLTYLVRLGFLAEDVKLKFAQVRLEDIEPAA